MTDQIGFIGGGNMAQALIGGLLADQFNRECIWVSEPNADARKALTALGVHTEEQIGDWLKGCNVVVLAVKPQILPQVLVDIGDKLNHALIISIAAGVSSQTIRGLLNGHARIIRAMPNTPALVRQGATGLFAEASITPADKRLAENILAVSGRVVWVDDETLMDAVTAVSGSGPAYFFYLMEHMMLAAQAQGMDERVARTLTAQTCLGAAYMLLQGVDAPALLRQRVTSPGGTTAAAIEHFEAQHMGQIIQDALRAAAQRSHELMLQMDQAAAQLTTQQH